MNARKPLPFRVGVFHIGSMEIKDNGAGVCLTGVTMNPTDFDKMLILIENNLTTPNPFITWNTNGIGFYEEWNKWKEVLSKHSIAKINLHRNSAEDTENAKCFCTKKKVLTLSDAKELFKEALTLRITMGRTSCHCKGSSILSKKAHSFRGGSVRKKHANRKFCLQIILKGVYL